MIVTQANLQALRTGFSKNYQDGVKQAQPNHEKISMVVPSSSASNTMGWLGQMPGFREWVGPRVVKNLKEHSYAIANKTFESTVGVARDQIEDDNLGVYSILMQQMGYKATMEPGKMVYSLLAAGFSELCYDGQYFFDTDHPVNAEHDGSGADSSVSNIQAGVGTNEPWFLLDLSGPIKPIIYQERKKPQFVSLTNIDDTHVFTNNEFLYGVDYRGNAGFGMWQQAFASREDLTAENFEICRAAMRAFKADGGEPLGIKPTAIVVGPSNLAAAEKLFGQKTLANGEDNILYRKVEIIETDYLA
ncbi:Mu-like prophage major head subunit gpT family protein [Thiomicrorhabdus indica]|uniref:Mu-like prophage major head subunit gpT family protein n=1 Tax=Thiomicrorhabdus indica TaxID=2267253 RepID=UPI002AA7A508|nr:Mu-like prophage major head subunit gpT family protein [Thiomicrorhabdus indica]